MGNLSRCTFFDKTGKRCCGVWYREAYKHNPFLCCWRHKTEESSRCYSPTVLCIGDEQWYQYRLTNEINMDTFGKLIFDLYLHNQSHTEFKSVNDEIIICLPKSLISEERHEFHKLTNGMDVQKLFLPYSINIYPDRQMLIEICDNVVRDIIRINRNKRPIESSFEYQPEGKRMRI